MGINRSLLPIKSHFFLYWGFMASAPPFVMVVARQVGVPLGVQGVVSAVVTATAVLVRPLIAALADTFPARRKIIFLALIGLMIAAYNPIGFLPPLQPPPHLSGRLVPSQPAATAPDTAHPHHLYLLAPYHHLHHQTSGECMVTGAWDCFASCQSHEQCPVLTHLSSGFKLFLRPAPNGLSTAHIRNATTLDSKDNESLRTRRLQEVTEGPSSRKESQSNLNHIWGERKKGEEMVEEAWSLKDNQTMVYVVEGVQAWSSGEGFNVSIKCQGGVLGAADGGTEACAPAVLRQTGFWVYVVLLLVAYITATTVESISDAICCDTIGEGGNYGRQRVWGVLSYGLLGAVSGLLVDWCSGDSTVRNYRPAFFLMTACGILDLLLSAVCLKVPKIEAHQKGVWANLGPLLRQVHFFIFLVTTFLIGLFDGLDTGFLFVLQEDIAESVGEPGHHVNMVQGLTLLVQAVSAIPCMFLCDRLMRRFGAQRVINTVLFLYSLRLLGLAAASHLGVLWVTALVEVINGPCFGLGYTAIVVHASALAPRGFSTTVQSVVGVCYGTLGYAGASFVGGVMYEALGGRWLYLVTGVAAFITWTLHLTYFKLCPPDIKAKELEEAEMGRQEELEVLQVVRVPDRASLEKARQGGGAEEEMLKKEQKEEKSETLLGKENLRRSVTEREEEERKAEGDSFLKNSTLPETKERGS